MTEQKNNKSSNKPLLAQAVDALGPFLCSERSLADIFHESTLSQEELSLCLKELLENKSLKQIRAGFIMRKDAAGRYLWYSKNAWDLSPQKPEKLVGFTDFDVAPEQAEFYRALDQEAMSSLERKTVNAKVYFCEEGYFKASARIIPLIDKNGLCDGVLLFSQLDFRLGEQSFIAIMKLLRKSGAYALVKKDKYTFEGAYGYPIELNRTECQIILYLLVGLSSKELSQKLNLSFRTAESYIAVIKDKFGVSTKSDLIDTIMSLGFLEKLD